MDAGGTAQSVCLAKSRRQKPFNLSTNGNRTCTAWEHGLRAEQPALVTDLRAVSRTTDVSYSNLPFCRKGFLTLILINSI